MSDLIKREDAIKAVAVAALEDMMHHGKNLGLKEGFERGYKAGYEDAEYEAKLMGGEIDIEEIDDETFESV